MSRRVDRTVRRAALVAVAFAVACPGTVARAQPADPVEVTASITPDSDITDTQPFELVVRITGSSLTRLSRPRLPNLVNLRVLGGPNSASSFQSVNGQVSVVQSFRYTLLADEPGPAEVPAVEVDVGGTTYRTEPIRFDVARASDVPDPGDGGAGTPADGVDVFVRARVSTERVWSGQAVVFRLDLFDAVGISEIDWVDVPAFSDFWVEDDAVQTRAESYTSDVAGKTYRVWPLVRKVLVPTRAGEFVIEPYAIRVAVASRRWDPFADPFRRRRTTVVRKTTPLTLRVRALPEEERPASFSGAVGEFSLSSEVDRSAATIDDAVTLRVAVEGSGFLKATAAPTLASTPQLRVFEPKVSDGARVTTAGLESSKAWEWVLVPLSAGEVELPEVEFAFFDPVAGAYRTLRSTPSVVRVSGSPGGTGRRAGSSLRPDRLDIAYVKLRFDPLRESSAPVHGTLAFQLLLWAPVAVVPVLALAGRRRARLLSDRRFLRSRDARRRAGKRLRGAERRMHASDGVAFHEEIAGALVDYVADRFDRSASGLTYDLADTLLAARGVPEELRDDFRRCLERCDFARFAHSSDDPERRKQVLEGARDVITRLEAAW